MASSQPLAGPPSALDLLCPCRDRKRAAELLLSRAPQLEPDESALIKKAAEIEERRRTEAAARKPAPCAPRAPWPMACALWCPWHRVHGFRLGPMPHPLPCYP